MHRHATRATGRLLVAAAALGATSGVAAAHSVGGTRFAAPLPLPLLFAGAAATVGLTALWLAVTGRRAGATRRVRVGTVPAGVTKPVATVAKVAFLVAVLAVVVLGVSGRQVRAENLATVFAWPVWFRGLALVAVLVGSPWPVLSPWRTLYDALCRLEGGRIAVVGVYPERLGSWPGLLGFVVLLGVLNNLTVVPDSPRLTAVVVASYGLWMLGGALAFGETWLDRADPLGVLYRLFGRVASLRLVEASDVSRLDGDVSRLDGDADGGGATEVHLVPPWNGCRDVVASHSLMVFVIATVYTVSFDGFTSTRAYQRLLFDAGGSLAPTAWMTVLLYLVGLLGFVAAYVAAVAVVEHLGTPDAGTASGRDASFGSNTNPRSGSVHDAARQFAPTVLPIAAAYEVAHNYPYVLRNLGQLWALVANPVASGTEPLQLLGWLSLPAFWGSQVVLIVLGHVVAVVAAHAVAVDRYDTVGRAKRAHLPLVLVMVGYTVLSLWIVSQPVVQ